MNWTVAFAPLLPLGLIAVFAALGALIVAGAFFGRLRGAWLRALAVAALTLALLNPSFLNEVRTPLPGVVALVVDRSQSQAVGDRLAETDAAVAELKDRLAAFPGLEVREVTVESDRGGGNGTRLFGALRDAFADVPPDRIAAGILVTDGQVHDAPAADDEPVIPAPIHALVTGRPGEIDRRVEIVKAPRFGLVDSTQQIEVRVEDQGDEDVTGESVEIVLLHEGEEVERRRVAIGEAAAFDVAIDRGGQNIFEFEVAERPGELTPVNNRAVVVIEGVRENLRVLLVSGEPHAGERTWRNLLKSDAAVDLVHFTILRPPEKQDGTPINELSLIAFPTRELFSEKIDQFDLIVFDRYQRRNVLPALYFDNIAQYVKGGGAVLVAAGEDYAGLRSIFHTPLAAVLPAEPTGEVFEQPFRPMISEIGKRHPVTRGLPGANTDPPEWSRWFRQIDAAPTSGRTVMTGVDGRPLLVLARQEKGRVALLLSDHVWLWARGYEGGGPHVPLLRRLAHWLMREPELEEEALRISADGADVVIERQTLGDSVGDVEVTKPSGETVTVTLEQAAPGLWRARLPVTEVGLYRASDGTLDAFGHVGPPNPKEIADLRSVEKTLEPAARATAGSVRRIAASGSVEVPRLIGRRRGRSMSGGDWIGLQESSATELQSVERIPLFAGFLGLGILLALLGGTWYREGN